MKAVGVVGSYRKGGTIDSAVDAALEGAQSAGYEIEKIVLTDKDIQFCRNCRDCAQPPGAEPGECVIDDDMREILETCRGAEVLILGSSVNQGAVTAVTKAFFERMLPMAHWPWGAKFPKRRTRHRVRPRAVLICSTSMPAFLGKRLTTAPATLRDIARTFDARVVAELFIGGAAQSPEQGLSARQLRQARRAGALAAWCRGLNPTWPVDSLRAALSPGR